jgi:hypothetical protein
VKDLKVFLRDTTQWSQLLLLVALALVYVYNFRVLDLDSIPYMSRRSRTATPSSTCDGGFVTAAVAVRFVFPAVSAEGAAFWIVRTRPCRCARSCGRSSGRARADPGAGRGADDRLEPFLGALPFLKLLCAAAIAFMTSRSWGSRRHGRASTRVSRREPHAGRGLLRRRRLHGAGGALHPDDAALLAWPSLTYSGHDFSGRRPAARRSS